MKEKMYKKGLSLLSFREANIWVTIAAVLFVVGVAWFWNAKLAAMVSGAAGLNFGKTGVTLVDQKNKAYPDFVSVDRGTVIQIGYRSQGVRSCTPNWRTDLDGAKHVNAGPYTVKTDSTLTVSCITLKGLTVQDSLQIRTGAAAETGDFQVYKPIGTDVWEKGKTYQITWQTITPAPCGRSDLGCDANIDPNLLKGQCENPSGDCSRTDVINCVKAPCDDGQIIKPIKGTVTISLNEELPACLRSTPACAIRQIAPYVITENAPNSGSYSWTIPKDLSATYSGKQQLTISVNGTGSRGLSAVFSIIDPRGGSDAAITVVSPNGGEQWVVGESRTVTWKTTNPGGKAIIQLREYRNCSQACTARVDRLYTLANPAVNNGSFSWVVGKSLEGGDVIPGQYFIVVNAGSAGTDESDAPFSVVAKGATTSSGIDGTIYYGPTCGGPISSNQKGCDDKPYKATIDILTSSRDYLKSFTSGDDGRFRVDLAPGTYILRSSGTTKFPQLSEQTVTVKANTYTPVTLIFDSGIR